MQQKMEQKIKTISWNFQADWGLIRLKKFPKHDTVGATTKLFLLVSAWLLKKRFAELNGHDENRNNVVRISIE